MKPRHLIEHDPGRWFAPGIENFRQDLIGLRAILDIPPDLDPVEWVQEHFYLSTETTGERQKFKLYGYQRGILEAMCDPSKPELVIPKATRTGVTQIATAAAAYGMGHKRAAVMMVQPTEQKAQKWANDYLAPAFRDSPLLKKLLRFPRKGQRQDTWDNRLYENGSRAILGARPSNVLDGAAWG